MLWKKEFKWPDGLKKEDRRTMSIWLTHIEVLQNLLINKILCKLGFSLLYYPIDSKSYDLYISILKVFKLKFLKILVNNYPSEGLLDHGKWPSGKKDILA